LTKNEIAKMLLKVLSSKKEADLVVNKIFKIMQDSLENGEKIVITGFGSFNVFETKIKNGRNPKTGEKLFIAPMKKVRFKQSKKFFE
jgi:nucleoid DNA-binding protein